MEKISVGSWNVVQITVPTGFAVGTINAYLLEGYNRLVLVDGGPNTESARQTLITALQDLGYVLADIDYVILTHGHVDHVGLAGMFQRAGSKIAGPEGIESWLNPSSPGETYRLRFYEEVYPQMGMPDDDRRAALKIFYFLQSLNDRSVVDFVLTPEAEIEWLPEFRVVYLPGHAQAALGLWHEASGSLFAGDELLPHISSNAIIEPKRGAEDGALAERTQSLLMHRATLKRIHDMNVQVVFPGHGPVFRDPSALILRRLAAHERRKQQMLDLVDQLEQPSAYDVAVEFFPTNRHEPSLILSETLGYLDWLKTESVLVETPDEMGVHRWYRVGATITGSAAR